MLEMKAEHLLQDNTQTYTHRVSLDIFVQVLYSSAAHAPARAWAHFGAGNF